MHELRSPSDPLESPSLPFHASESLSGRDIALKDGIWPEIYIDEFVSVSAAPIHHSVPCIGFVVNEAPVPGKMDPKDYLPHLKRTNSPLSLMSLLQQGDSATLSDGTVLQGPSRRPGRKMVILGDTYDPSPVAKIAMDADVLIHEATNAHLPGIDKDTKPTDTHDTVEARAKSRGHSTPQMAGSFAKQIKAHTLILNHFSARYPGNDDVDKESSLIMTAISKLAEGEFGEKVLCARDFMSFDVGFRS